MNPSRQPSRISIKVAQPSFPVSYPSHQRQEYQQDRIRLILQLNGIACGIDDMLVRPCADLKTLMMANIFALCFPPS